MSYEAVDLRREVDAGQREIVTLGFVDHELPSGMHDRLTSTTNGATLQTAILWAGRGKVRRLGHMNYTATARAALSASCGPQALNTLRSSVVTGDQPELKAPPPPAALEQSFQHCECLKVAD
jgi:hypothetical protein